MSSTVTLPTSELAAESRLAFFLRRVAARLVDQVVIAIPIVGVVVVGLAATALAGAGVATAVGGGEGLLAGVGAAMLVQLLVVFGGGILCLAFPLLYLRWAARRPGAQTLGRQLLGLRLSRSDGDRPLRGRSLVLREIALVVWLLPVLAASAITQGVTGSSSVGLLTQVGIVGLVAWRSVDGRLPHDRMRRTTTSVD